MAANVAVVRLIFRSIYAAAISAPPTPLQAELLSACLAAAPALLTGKQVVEAEASGITTKYQIPPVTSGMSLGDIAAALERLLTLYELALMPVTAVPPGAGLTGGVGPDDAAIYAWMMSQLAVVRSFSVSHVNPGMRP